MSSRRTRRYAGRPSASSRVPVSPVTGNSGRLDDRRRRNGRSETGAAVLAALVLLDEIGTADVHATGDEQLFGREARDHIAAARRHDDLFLDPRRGPAVGRSAVRLEREDHPLLELDRMLE